MYPVNHYVDPYHSHYRNHSPYPYYPPHGWEIPFSHPRPMDSSYRPATYGPWPYSAGMHRSHPSEFHCCCNRTYPPDYYNGFRPPLPQELPPPHLCYHGPFPQHSNTSPSYFVPPHPYPVDQMPYGYDKLKSHCCGCPNHVCRKTENNNVKIEEERPDVKLESEYKDADSGSIIRHPNNQYPFMWVPPSNMEGKENGKWFELSPQLLKEWAPMSRKMTGDVKKQNQDNQFLNGWAPVNSERTADVMHQEHGNQKEKQFHWPILWMPAGYDEPKQKAKEMKIEEAPNNSEEAPQSPKIKIIPLSWFENGHHDQKPATRDGSGDHGDGSATKSQPAVTEHRDGMTLEGSPKTTPVVPKRVNNESKPARENYKTIPVMPENEIDEKKASTYRTIPVTKESDEKKTGMSEKEEAKKASNADKLEENGKTKRSESSTAKHSKLPPVCLRVDPFPRKKSGNGSSRSPSPPTRKDDKAKKDVKEAAQGQKIEPKQSDTRHITVSEIKEKSPNEMEKGTGFSNESVQAASVEHARQEKVPTSKDEQKVQVGSTTSGAQESEGAKSLQGGAMQEKENSAESFKGCDKSKNEDEAVTGSEAANDDAKICKANLSEPDAAVRIQSACRGYGVRRWQPLDKLRKIRNVHEQMQGVKKQLQCLEDSCKKPTEKEQVAIGETIMNLLLKLDTIQGLHPSVREARKSVARELVCLQEKLDTLCKQQSGEFDHTNSDEEKSERTENIIQTVSPSPTVTTEACNKEERAVELQKVEEPSSLDSMEPYDAVPSGIPMEVKQDADDSKQKNEKEESCVTTMEEANEQGKAAGQFELQEPSLMDTLSDAALLEHHPTDNQEHKIEDSNAVSVEQVCEKSEIEGEGKELTLHDAASTGDSSGLKQYIASTEQSLHAEAESNTGLSYDSTEDIKASATAASVESGLKSENDGPVNGQDHRTAAVESLELRHDDSPAEENQQKELSGSVVRLEDSSLSLHEEQHDLNPVDDSVMSDTNDQLEEARDFSMQEQVVDSMEDSTKEQDGMLEDSMRSMELTLSGNAEKPDQPALLEPVLKSDSAPEETAVGESDDAAQCVVSGKDKPPHQDQEIEATIDKLTGGSANNGDSLPGTSRKEPDIQENHPNLAGEAECTKDEIAFPELDSFELSSHEGGITGHERSEMEVPSECQTANSEEECIETLKEAAVDTSTANSAEDVGVQVSITEECTKMPANSAEGVGVQVFVTEECTEMPANSAEGVGVQVSLTEKCIEMPEDAQVGELRANSAEDVGVQVSVAEKCIEGAVGANLAEADPDNPKEDIAVQMENKTSGEAVSAGASPSGEAVSAGASPLGDSKDSDGKKLAEENQQLKELLQKLLASGNDQMGVITDLSEKVKALEHKLARKKRPKVRVHRPSRHVTAKVH